MGWSWFAGTTAGRNPVKSGIRSDDVTSPTADGTLSASRITPSGADGTFSGAGGMLSGTGGTLSSTDCTFSSADGTSSGADGTFSGTGGTFFAVDSAPAPDAVWWSRSAAMSTASAAPNPSSTGVPPSLAVKAASQPWTKLATVDRWYSGMLISDNRQSRLGVSRGNTRFSSITNRENCHEPATPNGQ